MKNKRHLRLAGVIVSALLLVLTISGCAPKEEVPAGEAPVYLSLGTSSIGGVGHIQGTAISKTVMDAYPNIKILAEITGGYTDNLRLMQSGMTQLGQSTIDVVYRSYNGLAEFDTPYPDMRGVVCAPSLSYVQIYTMANSGIESVPDLRGKKMAIGAVGSMGNFPAELLTRYYGLEIGVDWTPEYLGHQDGADALVDGNVDAVLYFGTRGAPAPTSVALQHDMRVLSIPEEALDAIIAEWPCYLKGTMPAGGYRGVDYDVHSIQARGDILLVSKDVPEDVVYKITKACIEGADAINKMNPAIKPYTAEYAVENVPPVVPLHPGAERYYREMGALK